MTSDPRELLDELAGLRKRARGDRHGYWFPLLLTGILSLLSLPLSQADPNPADHLTDGGPGPWISPLAHLRLKTEVVHPLALSLYWLGALLVAVLATVWWYRWRARRVGVETPTGSYVRVALLGLVAVLFGIPLSTSVIHKYALFYPTPLVAAVAMAVLLGLAVLAFRAKRMQPLFIPVGLLLASIALSLLQLPDVGVDLGMGGGAQFMAISVGLLTLAWIERSVWCSVVAVVFTAGALIVDNASMENDALGGATGVLLLATVLVLGGLGALVASWASS
ncbi:hypothetical protein [Lentzea flaviverrucosa]|uniref:Uncharacterized protein n=1 Tax=Lentzea flaviverrucosa TaxID=200379 RepID=A0A1H9XSY2_9PSEU|nr:hypothetical protein [Lentzea flaviverrucosa]RDI19257.1 hypothetical protein DFR72_11799 [Lentzea flaviverrucosa]SES49236.1 hypothetical protein SAMN05216195_117119 [Lentzea flaviverrucosa]